MIPFDHLVRALPDPPTVKPVQRLSPGDVGELFASIERLSYDPRSGDVLLDTPSRSGPEIRVWGGDGAARVLGGDEQAGRVLVERVSGFRMFWRAWLTTADLVSTWRRA